jgi:hypothetical protein
MINIKSDIWRLYNDECARKDDYMLFKQIIDEKFAEIQKTTSLLNLEKSSNFNINEATNNPIESSSKIENLEKVVSDMDIIKNLKLKLEEFELLQKNNREDDSQNSKLNLTKLTTSIQNQINLRKQETELLQISVKESESYQLKKITNVETILTHKFDELNKVCTNLQKDNNLLNEKIKYMENTIQSLTENMKAFINYNKSNNKVEKSLPILHSSTSQELEKLFGNNKDYRSEIFDIEMNQLSDMEQLEKERKETALINKNRQNSERLERENELIKQEELKLEIKQNAERIEKEKLEELIRIEQEQYLIKENERIEKIKLEKEGNNKRIEQEKAIELYKIELEKELFERKKKETEAENERIELQKIKEADDKRIENEKNIKLQQEKEYNELKIKEEQEMVERELYEKELYEKEIYERELYEKEMIEKERKEKEFNDKKLNEQNQNDEAENFKVIHNEAAGVANVWKNKANKDKQVNESDNLQHDQQIQEENVNNEDRSNRLEELFTLKVTEQKENKKLNKAKNASKKNIKKWMTDFEAENNRAPNDEDKLNSRVIFENHLSIDIAKRNSDQTLADIEAEISTLSNK